MVDADTGETRLGFNLYTLPKWRDNVLLVDFPKFLPRFWG